MSFIPIGRMKTCFDTKNGTPRQPTVSPFTKGYVTIEKSVFTNPEHSLECLEEFSHVWVLFQFHLNKNKSVKAKVRPPRLDGVKKGVFATRSPHRPNAIGLTLAKLDKIEGCTVHLSGLDIVDGTPVIDLKPYISLYDVPTTGEKCGTGSKRECVSDGDRCQEDDGQTSSTGTPDEAVVLIAEEKNQPLVKSRCGSGWVSDIGLPSLKVLFTSRAEQDLRSFIGRKSDAAAHCLHHLGGVDSLRRSIVDILAADPRSTYRRKKCSDRLYYFLIDGCHITSWFDYTTTPATAEVLRIKTEHMIEKTFADSRPDE